MKKPKAKIRPVITLYPVGLRAVLTARIFLAARSPQAVLKRAAKFNAQAVADLAAQQRRPAAVSAKLL